jgi:hypothetical protein
MSSLTPDEGTANIFSDKGNAMQQYIFPPFPQSQLTFPQNPFPNVDSSSGVLFHFYGFKETLYYTATFGVSRGLGPLAQLIWDRALGLPIERPKSINLQGILDQVN